MAILVMFPPLSIPLSISRWQGQDHRGAVAATGELTMENPCWIKPPANHASFFHCPVRQVVSDVFWMYSLTFLNVFPHVFSEICYQRWGNHRSSRRWFSLSPGAMQFRREAPALSEPGHPHRGMCVATAAGGSWYQPLMFKMNHRISPKVNSM